MADKKIFKGGEFLICEVAPGEVFAPEEFSEEQRLIQKTAQDFVRSEITPQLERIEQKDKELTRQLLAKAGELGLLSTDIPERYGGLGLDKVSTNIVTETIGSLGSFSVAHSVQTGIGVMPIVYFGDEQQKQRYLPAMATGAKLGAYCLTEAGAGSDALASRTKAVLSEDKAHYVLNGEKIFITNGGIADRFIVYAKVDGEKFTGFVVERDAPGLSLGREEDKMGMRGASTCSVIMEDVKVPKEDVLFEVGKGHKIAFNVLNLGRWKLGASVVGGCKAYLGEAVKYANGREQFERPISSFGLIQEKLAAMAVRTFIGESIMYRIAHMMDCRLATIGDEELSQAEAAAKAIGEYAIECSIAKVFGSELFDFCVDENVQIHGGYGYIGEYAAERHYRDSRINRIWEGTSEINRLLISGTMLRRAMTGRLPLLAAAKTVADDLLSYSPMAVKLGDEPLALQRHMVAMSKKLVLAVAGAAAMKFGTELAEEQEVLAAVADLVIDSFAMESGLLRAEKKLLADGEARAEPAIVAVRVYVDETVPNLDLRAKKILAYIAKGDELLVQLAGVKKLMRYQPIDAVSLKRKIAGKVIEREEYPF